MKKRTYTYQPLGKLFQKAPAKIKSDFEKSLHRGSSGRKDGMWFRRASVVEYFTNLVPKRFVDLGERESFAKIKEEVVGV